MKHNSNDEHVTLVSLSVSGKRSWVFVFVMLSYFVSGQLYDRNNSLTVADGTVIYSSDSAVVSKGAKAESPKIYIAGNAVVYGLNDVEKVKSGSPSEKTESIPAKLPAKAIAEKKQSPGPKTSKPAIAKNEVKISKSPSQHFHSSCTPDNSCIAPAPGQQIKYHFFDNDTCQNFNLLTYYKDSRKNPKLSSVVLTGFKKIFTSRPPPVYTI